MPNPEASNRSFVERLADNPITDLVNATRLAIRLSPILIPIMLAGCADDPSIITAKKYLKSQYGDEASTFTCVEFECNRPDITQNLPDSNPNPTMPPCPVYYKGDIDDPRDGWVQCTSPELGNKFLGVELADRNGNGFADGEGRVVVTSDGSR
ncbi:hypothetical protein KJ742_04010 [Patescibacteria group bacterium]|nr:hypothetical protein [Patescibacteria group bacterium]MBU1683086.1 hypothetical protein [Patescibacteria group bacterium]MBU1935153.1 hypothetical protein [Patescibacteria group bacterium]